MLLVRVVVGKIKNLDHTKEIFRNIPLRPDVPGWNCVEWVKEAFETALADGGALGTAAPNWTAVRDTAMDYVAKKKAAHRFDGQGKYDQAKAATWDLLEGKELQP